MGDETTKGGGDGIGRTAAVRVEGEVVCPLTLTCPPTSRTSVRCVRRGNSDLHTLAELALMFGRSWGASAAALRRTDCCRVRTAFGDD